MRTSYVFSGPTTIALFFTFFLVQSLSASVVDTVKFSAAIGNAVVPDNNQIYLGEEDPKASACSVHLLQDYQVKGACGDSITYSVDVFLAGNSLAIEVIHDRKVALDSEGSVLLQLDTRDNDLASTSPYAVSGIPYSLSSCFGAMGLHRIVWTVTSDCETSSHEFLADVVDESTPRLSCIGLSSIVLPSSCSVLVYAKDFVAQVLDDCTLSDDILYSFSKKGYEPSRLLDNQEFSCNGLSFTMEVTVADEGRDVNCNGSVEWEERQKSTCEIWFVIDPGTCVLEEVFVYGSITAGGMEPHPTSQVFVDVNGVVDRQQTATTLYQMNVPCHIDGDKLEVYCEREGNPRSGVSTLDLAKMQQHILGYQPFTHPYQYLAADVTGDERVSLVDVIATRKVILRLLDEYPIGKTWHMVHSDHVFADPDHPWPIPLRVQFDGDTRVDFTAIKIGDLHSFSHLTETPEEPDADALYDVVARSGSERHLVVEDRLLLAGEEYAIPFYSGSAEEWSGLQLTLEEQGLTCIGIQPGAFDMDEDWIARHDAALTMCYAPLKEIHAENGQALFTLLVRADKNVRLSEALSLSSRITKAEAYVTGSEGIGVSDLDLIFSEGADVPRGQFELFQNTPNPFQSETTIGFYVPEKETCVLSIFNLHGQLIYEENALYAEGTHEITIHHADLGGAGVYYYQLVAGKERAIRKCTVLD